ncbi:LysR family transcriptional regulator [Nodularia spumigena CS-584]|jgi:DNA-binding transcriptional LysR family regulator|uniref:LysR family transcriptional regulator n=1 Tax=Nodularia spumigena UHCC 0060 TaxID=3110300 RepID=A0ABU5UW12_NODSP|nr:LysR family transcriptional regulator [Nodularia spumigena]AHJ29832.1 LysR family transcriptional regulator YeiE [Nodularia spumigena CCY9414]EAW43000.1 transcriptional regulator [Nodularia spumigena CCY9414]MDB9306284.1 LysR family transcriptional regulator [Nodularia spumigena CS-591/12]MDB9347894.1 LysR family transcriptional regulator [Nodularia spumigena CS-588/01]MDB9352527.1 LysR family transcriptional regulator [Nodularia spumigena CS-588/05]
MNFEYVESFLAVVHTGSFHQAAKHLGISQPAVSQHIKKLETSLNTQLIIRDRKGNQLTPAAQKLLPYAESLILVTQRAVSALKSTELRIGASSNIGIYLLPPYLKYHLEQYGNSDEVDLVIDTNPAIANQLEIGLVDIALMEWWDNRPGFTAQLWQSEELVFIVPPIHPWRNLPKVPKAHLENIEMLGGERGTGTGRLLQQFFGEQVHKIRISMQLGSTEAVKRAVQAGLGVSIVLSKSVTQEVQAGLLHAIPIDVDGKTLRKELFVIRRSSLSVNSPVHQFTQMLLNELT